MIHGGYTNCIHRVYVGGTMKESGLRIRVDPDLRQSFIELCREQDQTASQVIRNFMREYVKEHTTEKQGILFAYDRGSTEY